MLTVVFKQLRILQRLRQQDGGSNLFVSSEMNCASSNVPEYVEAIGGVAVIVDEGSGLGTTYMNPRPPGSAPGQTPDRV